MKRREILLTVAALLVLIVLPSTGHGGLNPWDWKYGLAQEQQIIIRDCVLEGRAQVKALSTVMGMKGVPLALVFDRPFMIIMKEKRSPLPYLAIWVGNGELLSPR